VEDHGQVLDFSGRTVLLTGGTSGLGREATLSFARAGAKVVAAYKEDKTKADSLRETLLKEGLDARIIKLDVTNAAGVEAAVAEIAEREGPVEILINSAGVNRSGTVHRLSPEDWETVISVNLTGAFFCMRAVIPGMKEAGTGRIINIGSVLGFLPDIGVANYTASKAGLAGLTKAAALELARSGVTVNMLSPGYFEVGMIQEVPQDVLAAVIKSTPVRRLGKVDEFTHALTFLASNDAGFVTGHVLHVNGGRFG